MTISIGDRIPDVTIKTNGADGPKEISTGELFAGKKVVMFAVPGAFTPTCSNTHMPDFVDKADEIKAKGADTIACMAVNDAYVLDAWQKQQQAEALIMLADAKGDFTKALGLGIEVRGMGIRCTRVALIANDGVVEYIGIDPKGVDKSSANTVLEHL